MTIPAWYKSDKLCCICLKIQADWIYFKNSLQKNYTKILEPYCMFTYYCSGGNTFPVCIDCGADIGLTGSYLQQVSQSTIDEIEKTFKFHEESLLPIKSYEIIFPNGSTGHLCKVCQNPFPYVTANQRDGSYICPSDRTELK